MDIRPLGRSGLEVSALALGSWMTYESLPEADALSVLSAGLDAGITFLDDARYDDRTGTAPMRTGYSEVLFGRLLRQTGRARENLVISNKLWFEFYPDESVEDELNGSLQRLQMDYLDIEYCAEPPESMRLIDLIARLDRLITAGKLRAWGALNWSAARLDEAEQVARLNGLRGPSTAQLAYSVVHRSPVEDPETVRAVTESGIGIVASYSLAGGLLSGKYSGGQTSGHRLHGQLDDARVKPLLSKIEPFRQLASDMGCTPAQLAIAYCLRNPRVASVLFGARRVPQITENVGALAVAARLSDDVLTALKAL